MDGVNVNRLSFADMLARAMGISRTQVLYEVALCAGQNFRFRS